MAQLGQTLIPLGSDFDTSKVFIKSDKSFFAKGLTADWQDANNAGELKPEESNYLYCSVGLPEGVNICIGTYEYTEAKELYIVVHNSEGNHLVYRIEGNTANCRIVYRFCKDFAGISLDPKYWFSKGRMTIKSICVIKPSGQKVLYKELLMVNKLADNIRIVVEDSIATNSFSTPFFNTDNSCCSNSCRLIKTGVQSPNDKIDIEPIPATPAQRLKQNRMYQKIFKFRFKNINAWNQPSEHGIISDTYFTTISGCGTDASALPHCVWLKTKLPCPEITRIVVEFSACEFRGTALGNDADLLSDWKEYSTIDLYDQTNPNAEWYERIYDTSGKDFEISDDKKTIRIKFCNNKKCDVIAASDIRDENPAPIKSGTVANLGKGLVYGDNEFGFDKIPKEDLEKVQFDLVEEVGCEPKYSRVKVYAVVANLFYRNQPQAVFRTLVNQTNVWGFGGHRKSTSGNVDWNFDAVNPEPKGQDKGGSGQRFPDGVQGFRASLGGVHFAESKQYLATDDEDLLLAELIDSNTNIGEYIRDNIRYGSIFVQEFDFGVIPCGKWPFRIHGHSDTLNLVNTSTFYIATIPYKNYQANWNVPRNFIKEIIVDTTSGNDYNSIETEDLVAVIADVSTGDSNASSGTRGDTTRVIRGYVYEGLDSLVPLSQEVVTTIGGNGTPLTCGFTDHNGFYFVVSRGSGDTNFNSMFARIYGVQSCLNNQLLASSNGYRGYGTVKNADIYATKLFTNFVTNGCNRHYIEGTVKECGTDAGIAGVPVTLQGAQTVFTDGKGAFRIVLHYTPRRITDRLIVSPSVSCLRVDCNCNTINIDIPITHPLCQLPCPGTFIRDIGSFSLKTVVAKGLEFGGRYGIAMYGHDGIRRQYAQFLNDWFVDIPTEQEQGNNNKKKIRVTLPPSFSDSVCRQFNTLIFSITKNLNHSNYIQWAADKVEFIDAAGNLNQSNPSKVKIWYRSLNEYNRLRGFNTNSNFNIADANNNAVVGDIVEFIQQADGVYLPVGLEAIVQHDQQGSYFLIDYELKYQQLKDGVRFKLKRPFNCETTTLYYDYHFPLNLCGGGCVPRDSEGNPVTEFIMDVYDSYLYPRQIPVVTDVIELLPATDGATQKKITEVKTVKNYLYRFEHHSPNDTWGFKCSNVGRVNARNLYEARKCNRNQLMITGAINADTDGAINYLHYFSLADELFIDEQGWGGIQAIIVRDDGAILLICEQSTFTLMYNDNRAVVGQDGYIQVPANNRFSRPDRDAGFNHGCQSKDLNTIQRKGSIVFFFDSQRSAAVIHNFSTGQSISVGVQSWLTGSDKEVQSTENMYWHSVIDNKQNRVLLSKFNLGKPIYQNQLIEKDYTANETLAFNLTSKAWGLMHHCTPEYWGSLFGDDTKESQLFAFRNGLPYAMYSKTPSAPFLNYFGVQCSPVFGLTTNREPMDVKSFLFNEVYCREMMFIIPQIETEANQKSLLLEGDFETGEGIYYAAYLCDTANADKCAPEIKDILYDGDTLFGRWLTALYTARSSYKGEFFKLTSVVSYISKRENSGNQ